jgi:tetratricopeptide (TPR) repeat protein
MPRKIFISYRREDSAANALGIAQYLERAFGRRNVFLDIDMRSGSRFPEELEKRLAECKVLLAVIGPGWGDAQDDEGRRRLNDPEDWVRLEISRALKRGITVIPARVGGAGLPKKGELPDDIKGLLDHQAASVGTTTFRNDMAGLVRDIRAIPGGFPWLGLAAVAVVLTGVGIGWLAYEGAISKPTHLKVKQDKEEAHNRDERLVQPKEKSDTRVTAERSDPIVTSETTRPPPQPKGPEGRLVSTTVDTKKVECEPQALAKSAINTCAGIASLCRGRGSKAIQSFLQACDHQNKDSNKGDISLAIDAYTAAIKSDESFAAAYNLRGLAYRRKGEIDQAISDYSKAIELNDLYVEAYSHRGFAYNHKDNYVKAINDFNRAISINANFEEAWQGLGETYHREKKYDEAIENLTKSITLNGQNAKAYNARGVVYHDRAAARNRESDFDLAIADYTKAIELDKNYAGAYKNRAFAYRKKNDLESAIADYTKAIEIYPEFQDAYNGRGFAYSRRNKAGDRSRAIADYRQALKLNSDHELAKQNLRALGVKQ